jgi:hypothetical protein
LTFAKIDTNAKALEEIISLNYCPVAPKMLNASANICVIA